MTFGIAKSYLAVLAGIALGDGLIPDIDARVAETVPGDTFASYGYLRWLNTGKREWPAAPESSYAAVGAGTSIIWIDPDHDDGTTPVRKGRLGAQIRVSLDGRNDLSGVAGRAVCRGFAERMRRTKPISARDLPCSMATTHCRPTPVLRASSVWLNLSLRRRSRMTSPRSREVRICMTFPMSSNDHNLMMSLNDDSCRRPRSVTWRWPRSSPPPNRTPLPDRRSPSTDSSGRSEPDG